MSSSPFPILGLKPHRLEAGRPRLGYLDGVVPKAADDLVVIILQAVDSFTVLRATLDPLQVVSAAPPVRLDGLEREGGRGGGGEVDISQHSRKASECAVSEWL